MGSNLGKDAILVYYKSLSHYFIKAKTKYHSDNASFFF